MGTWQGYHGTNVAAANVIIKEGFIPSGKKEWIGSGIYFFGDLQPITSGIKEAINWARIVRKHRRWAVMSASIDNSNAFDLLSNEEHRAQFYEIETILKERHSQSGLPIRDFRQNSVFVAIAETNNYYVVRAFCDSKKAVYFAPVAIRPQVQICVKNVAAIKSCNIYKTGDDDE